MADCLADLDGYDPAAIYGAKHEKLLAELESQLFSDDVGIRKFDISRNSTGQMALLKSVTEELTEKRNLILYFSIVHRRESYAECNPQCDKTKTYGSVLLLDSLDNKMLRTLLSSVHSLGTICPLQVTKDLMLEILHVYQVSPDFLPVLYSFGCAPHIAEGSSNNLAVQTLEDGNVKSKFEHYLDKKFAQGT